MANGIIKIKKKKSNKNKITFTDGRKVKLKWAVSQAACLIACLTYMQSKQSVSEIGEVKMRSCDTGGRAQITLLVLTPSLLNTSGTTTTIKLYVGS